MKTYLDLGGKSGIRSYETGLDFIKVMFSSGSVYLYDYACTGMECVEKMKELAIKGTGLNSYIGKVVRGNYKLRIR